MSHIYNITEAKKYVSLLGEIVSRFEQSEYAYKEIAADEFRYKYNGIVLYLEECEAGEFEFSVSEFYDSVLELTLDMEIADKILSEI